MRPEFFMVGQDERVHVERVDYDFDLAGASLDELGAQAAAKARALFGNYAFRITNIAVQDLPDGRYGARAYAELAP